MQSTTLYSSFARTLQALNSCERSGNKEWEGRHRETLDAARQVLPSGSGFDSGSYLDVEASTPDRLVIRTSYHHMNDSGYYVGWSDHSVIVTPSLGFGADIRIVEHRASGKHRVDESWRDYAHEVFAQCLNEYDTWDTFFHVLTGGSATVPAGWGK